MMHPPGGLSRNTSLKHYIVLVGWTCKSSNDTMSSDFLKGAQI